MNAKDRVLMAIALQQPDRVPLDLSANVATLERLHVDIVDLRGVVDPLYRGPVARETWLPNGVKQNYWGWRTPVQQTPTGPEEMYCDVILAPTHVLQTDVPTENVLVLYDTAVGLA